MWIQSIQCRQYRNYQSLMLECAPFQNVFLGRNAAGKTNILEALYFLSHGKSHRTRQDREFLQWQQPFCSMFVQAQSHRHGGMLTLESQLSLTADNRLKTVFKLNGQALKSRSDAVGKIPTVGFFHHDLLMLRGAPEDRRNALDGAIVQADSTHFKRLSLYHRIRQQKSQWLKLPSHQQDQSVLDSLNEQLAEAGAALIFARVNYLAQLESLAVLRYAEIATESLAFNYHPSFKLPMDSIHPDKIKSAFLEALHQRTQDEWRRQQVLVGPHRDDIGFYLDGYDAIQFASQGQQRSVVLAFKLAEIELLKQTLQNESPILLLDDVMAELDLTRQESLLRYLDPQMQVFVTTTHLTPTLQSYIHQHESAKLFQVSAGSVEPFSSALEVLV